MAKSHTTDGGYTNPEVRFERTDIDAGKVVRFAATLTVVLVVSAVLATVVGRRLTRMENRVKETTLPPAAIDRVPGAGLPPEPRLESFDDLRERDRKNIELYPPRAAEFLRKQEAELEKGDLGAGVEPIGVAIEHLAGKLPARKQRPPASFGVELPSKASSGRSATGGEGR